MSAKISIEEAAERLEAIARSRRVQEAIGEIADRVETANRLKKASGHEGLREATAADHPGAAKDFLSGKAVARSPAELSRDQG